MPQIIHNPRRSRRRHPAQASALLRDEALLQTHREALARRSRWNTLWQECYENALPHHESSGRSGIGSAADAPYDGTAAHAAALLAASLLGEIAPPNARWCGIEPAADLSDSERLALAAPLEQTERILSEHLAQSNFSVELHQALLDLVVGGTGCLLAEVSGRGARSALLFQAVPLSELALAPSESGDIGTVFRRRRLSLENFKARFPAAAPAVLVEAKATEGLKPHNDTATTPRIAFSEAVRSDGCGGWQYSAFIDDAPEATCISGAEGTVLHRATLAARPFIVFRWVRAPGELWGRSPVMQALPEIRTANRLVEFSLRKAAFASLGVFQLDDDGVLDPTSVHLEPGTILPRAPGSRGLTPLDLSPRGEDNQLVLEELRSRIRATLLADRLAPAPRGSGRTATEVLSDASDNARILGAHYGRLASELVTPLALRVLHLLASQNLLPPPFVSDHLAGGKLPQGVVFRHRAPLAQLQLQRDSANFFLFLERLIGLGTPATETVDLHRAVRYGAQMLGVPETLLKPPPELLSEAKAELSPELNAELNRGLSPELDSERLADAESVSPATSQ